MSVEVGVVHKRREVGGSGDCQRTFDHAADHDAQVVRPCNVNHFERGSNPAAFHKLYIDAIHTSSHAGNIFDGDATFVGDDGRERCPYQFQSCEVMCGNGLLDKFDIVGSEGLNIFDGFFRCPASVGINTKVAVGDIANGFDDVEVVFCADFDFENRIVTATSAFFAMFTGVSIPNGKRGMRAVQDLVPVVCTRAHQASCQ